MAFCWHADDGPTLNSGLAVFTFCRGTVLLKNLRLCDFSRGGLPAPLWIWAYPVVCVSVVRLQIHRLAWMSVARMCDKCWNLSLAYCMNFTLLLLNYPTHFSLYVLYFLFNLGCICIQNICTIKLLHKRIRSFISTPSYHYREFYRTC